MYCISYSDSYYGGKYQGVLVKEDEKYYYICEPLHFLFAEYMNKTEWLNDVPLFTALKGDFYFYEIPFPKISEKNKWIFEACSLIKDATSLKEVSYFFEHFLFFYNQSLEKRLEECISLSISVLSEKTIKEAVQFIVKRTSDSNERLRIIFSDKIKKYLYE